MNMSDNGGYHAVRAPSVSLGHGLRILLVDSDGESRAGYRACFECSGYEVIEAADGREALIKALDRPPSLVVTDAALPFLDGCALCDILRRDHATAGVRMLVLAASTRPRDADRARAAGAHRVLMKPATPEQVLVEAQRLLTDTSVAGGTPLVASPAAVDVAGAPPPRTRLSKSFARFVTTTPPASPPLMICPSCDRPLMYEYSNIGGVSARYPEQWDQLVCPGSCGTFQYRHRTRTIRRTT